MEVARPPLKTTRPGSTPLTMPPIPPLQLNGTIQAAMELSHYRQRRRQHCGRETAAHAIHLVRLRRNRGRAGVGPQLG